MSRESYLRLSIQVLGEGSLELFLYLRETEGRMAVRAVGEEDWHSAV